jgi:hypothetical protein
MTINEFFDKILPLLLSHSVDRIEKDLDIGKVTAYWVVSVIRIDIKVTPKEEDF